MTQRTPTQYEDEIADLRADRRQYQDALGVARAEIEELKQKLAECEMVLDQIG